MYCERDGTWWAGRYVGSLVFEGRRLTIAPRFGLATIRDWLSGTASAVPVTAQGRLREDESFIVQLLALVWTRSFLRAARHGLPMLRQDRAVRGATIRGRLDVRASLLPLAQGGHEAVSIRSERSLAHAASAAIVAAYGALRRWLPGEGWLDPRVRDMLPPLIAVTGYRPRTPTQAELERVRYTPITAGFAPFAELSRRIAVRRGLGMDAAADGETTGILLDIAELWELYVLSVLRKALPSWTVQHGTRARDASRSLLRSEVSGRELGTLIPDAVLSQHGAVRGIVDAKYKSLHPTGYAPLGPQREDLYQMTAYLGRYTAEAGSPLSGILAYPHDPKKPFPPAVEAENPWRLADGKKILFVTLPHAAAEAVPMVRELFR